MNMNEIFALTLVISPLLAMAVYAVYLKIQRNKAGLGPVLTGERITPVGEFPYVGAFGARESWSDMSIKDESDKKAPGSGALIAE